MKKGFLIPLVLMSIIFLIPKAYAIHIFPLGKYDIDPDFCSVSGNRIVCSDQSYIDKKLVSETSYTGLSIPNFYFYSFGYVRTIKTDAYVLPNILNYYLDYDVNLTTSKYLYICYYSERPTSILLGYKDLNSNTYNWVLESDSDTTRCLLFNLTRLVPYFEVPNRRIAIGANVNGVGFASTYFITIQFLTLNFTTAEPVNQNYYLKFSNDFSDPSLGNRPFGSWGAGPNVDLAYGGLWPTSYVYNGIPLGRMASWTYNSSSGGDFGIEANRGSIGFTGVEGYNSAYVSTIVSFPRLINKLCFVIEGKPGYNSVEIDFDRANKKVHLFLLDPNRVVIDSKTDLFTPVDIIETYQGQTLLYGLTQFIFIKEDMANADGRFVFINNDYYKGIANSFAFNVPSYWLSPSSFFSDSQLFLFFTDPAENEMVQFDNYQLYILSYFQPTAPPVVIKPGYNYTAPLTPLNFTDWQTSGYGWALFLFSPMFIATIMGVVGAGMVAGKMGGEEKGLVFVGAFLAFVFIFMLVGFYPIWLGIILVIMSIALIVYFVRSK